MRTDLKITKSISINATKDKVWDVLTNPAKIKKYLFGTETVTDWKPGSPIVFQGEWQGQSYKDKGTILNIRRNQLLEYDYWSSFSGLEDKPENYSKITFTLEKKDSICYLSLIQSGFADEKSQKHSMENWIQVLEKFKQIAETE